MTRNKKKKNALHEPKDANENVPAYIVLNTKEWLDEIHEGQKLWIKSLGRDIPHKKDDEKD